MLSERIGRNFEFFLRVYPGGRLSEQEHETERGSLEPGDTVAAHCIGDLPADSRFGQCIVGGELYAD